VKCPQCAFENRPQAKFCEECATPLARACANCGSSLSPTAKFCPECAHPVAAGTVTQQRFSSPETYTPKHLAEKILTSKGALEGERKQVTVLFADMKGSMELLADRDPEEARKILDPVLEHMMEAVHRYEGTVNQVLGDGIMALFGAPLAHEDHAVRACYAALRMQESLRQHAEGVRRVEGIPIQIRVGINSGEVVVRSIRSDLHMDYTAVGQTTHVAARMEQMAVPGSILLSAETMTLAEGYIEVKPLGPLPVKGLETPIEVYELSRAATVRSRFQIAAARGLTRFVGRESELDQLRQALERARSGHGQVAAVVGEPGVGKSRLYWEFSHSHRAQGWLSLESRSVSYGKATNYLPIIELLRVYFDIEQADDSRKIREKVTGKLLSLDRQLEPYLPPILWLLDVPIEDEKWERLDPPQRRERVLDGVKRLLLCESQVQPLMVLFEDLHWIDAETQVFLDSLVESLPTARLLLLVNYRPEYSHGWGSKTYYRQIQIDPLPPESAEALLDALLGTDAKLFQLKRLLIERTEGNPFFIEESVRSLAETGVLVGERGTYRLTRSPESFQVPATARAILAARIDRLAPEDKRLLQAAAVIGTDVPWALLQAVTNEPEDQLRRELARLQATEFLYETRLFPDLEYTFRHALTHEVAYGSLLTERRRDLHARIVEAMEKLYGDRLDEQVEKLAYHTFRGEVWEKAILYLRRAGVKACDRSANREAVAYFEQGLGVLEYLPQTRQTLELGIDLRLSLRASLMPLGNLDQISKHLREAERLATRIEDQGRLGWTSAHMSGNLWMTGHLVEGRAFGQTAQGVAETLGDTALRVMANLHLGLICNALGDYPRADALLRETVLSLAGDLSQERFGLPAFPAVTARSFLARLLGQRGEFREGIALGHEAVRIAESFDHPYSVIQARRDLGYLYGLKGDFGEAINVLERGLARGREGGVTLISATVTAFLGHVYALSGAVTTGLPMLQQGLQAREAMGAALFHSLLVVELGEVYLLANRLADARGVANRALALACERQERGYEAWAVRLLGEISARDNPLDIAKAENHYRQALALAEDLGMRPLIAHCHVGLGKLYRRIGSRQQAEEHLTRATTMMREMEMALWLEQANADLKELG
jgi:class 3 adenylate cyclase/tetratricopeptide (TPR) repeat protein